MSFVFVMTLALLGDDSSTPLLTPRADVLSGMPDSLPAEPVTMSEPLGEYTPLSARMEERSWWKREWSQLKWRGLLLSNAWVGESGNHSFSSYDLEFSVPFMRTLGSDDRALMFSPGAGFHRWDAPADYRLPDFVYEVTFDVGLRWKINDRWRVMMGVTPGTFTDTETSGSGFRIPARLLAIYQWSETLSLTLGAVYLNRDDIPVVPGIGFTWTPHERLKVDANMPRPRISYLVYEEAGGAKWWAYTGAALGGGQWEVRRDGLDQIVTLRQFHLVAGIERRPIPFFSMFLEGGWVFGREVEIPSTKETFIPSDSFIIRFGAGY